MKLDWDATWRNWVRKATEDGKNLTTTGGKGAGLSTSRPASLGFHRNGLMLEMGEATIYEDRVPTEAQRANPFGAASD